MKIKLFTLSLLVALCGSEVNAVEFTTVTLPSNPDVGPVFKCDSKYAFASLDTDKRVMQIYSSDFQVQKTISFPGYVIGKLETVDCDYNGSPINVIMASQYLFNDDDLFEFIVHEDDDYWSDYLLFNENGENLGVIPSNVYRMWNGIVYLCDSGYSFGPSYFYLFDQSDNSNNPGNGSSGGPMAEANLSIYGNQTYVLDLSYPYGSCATIEIEPQNGWEIYSVVFNEEDVTDKLEDSKFITNPLSGENTLEILMVENAGISNIRTDSQNRISIKRESNGVAVANIGPNEVIKIYDIKGIQMYVGTDRFIPLKEKGLYILKSENATIKFAF